ncbi:MAG: ribonuclease P protein component [Phycisphaeraceae bacterium]
MPATVPPETSPQQPEPAKRFKYTRAHRLGGDKQFQAVFANKLRKSSGPLAVLALPNDLPHHRFGMTVSRRVGNAVKRSRIKRYLREAFRLNQHDLPGRYDLVVIVYPHEVLKLEEYADHLAKAVGQLHTVATKRAARHAEGAL